MLAKFYIDVIFAGFMMNLRLICPNADNFAVEGVPIVTD